MLNKYFSAFRQRVLQVRPGGHWRRVPGTAEVMVCALFRMLKMRQKDGSKVSHFTKVLYRANV